MQRFISACRALYLIACHSGSRLSCISFIKKQFHGILIELFRKFVHVGIFTTSDNLKHLDDLRWLVSTIDERVFGPFFLFLCCWKFRFNVLCSCNTNAKRYLNVNQVKLNSEDPYLHDWVVSHTTDNRFRRRFYRLVFAPQPAAVPRFSTNIHLCQCKNQIQCISLPPPTYHRTNEQHRQS